MLSAMKIKIIWNLSIFIMKCMFIAFYTPSNYNTIHLLSQPQIVANASLKENNEIKIARIITNEKTLFETTLDFIHS